ncbi:unnamed protein product [Rhizophagus irregularis]|nr:unnamed protein product [Rhizophagus irregularis]
MKLIFHYFKVYSQVLHLYVIVKCPFVALVCIGIHNHPPSVPERISSGIKNNLESLIIQAIQQDDNVTSRSILSSIKY